MRILADTSVVLRFGTPSDPTYERIAKCLEAYELAGDELFVTPQVLRGCWVVMTRPLASNGFGFSISDARTYMAALHGAFSVIEDAAGMYAIWEKLVFNYQVSGKQAHDANLVAAIKAHGLDAILTFNPDDFTRYDGFQILMP